MTNNPLMDLRRLDEEKRRKNVSDTDPAQNPVSESSVTTLQDYNAENNEETMKGVFERSQQETPLTTKPAAGGRRRLEGSKTLSPANTHERETLASVPDTREERLKAAMQLAQEDEPGVVTIRISPRLNAYVDRYVQRVNQIDPRRRYRKQDAVAEAFAAFYADHPMPPSPRSEDAL